MNNLDTILALTHANPQDTDALDALQEIAFRLEYLTPPDVNTTDAVEAFAETAFQEYVEKGIARMTRDI